MVIFNKNILEEHFTNKYAGTYKCRVFRENYQKLSTLDMKKMHEGSENKPSTCDIVVGQASTLIHNKARL